MSQIIKATFEAFAGYLCKGTVNVNVGSFYTVYFTLLKDGRVFIDCNLWFEGCNILHSFYANNGVNILEAYKLYSAIFDISQHEK